MTIYTVTAQSFNRTTGIEYVAPRDEQIDTEDNELFKDCHSILDIKATYESFWNDINPSSKEIVFVQRIRKVDQ